VPPPAPEPIVLQSLLAPGERPGTLTPVYDWTHEPDEDLAICPDLHGRPFDSPNTAWRNASFRGFADYMLTDDFEPGPPLERVVRRFGDHRGYLYFCSLGGALLANGLIHAAPPRDAPGAGVGRA